MSLEKQKSRKEQIKKKNKPFCEYDWKKNFFRVRYVDILAGTLKQKLSLIDKMVNMQKLVIQRREEAREQAISLQPMLKLVIQRTRELQNEVSFV